MRYRISGMRSFAALVVVALATPSLAAGLLQLTLTPRRPSFRLGHPVRLLLTETNVSDHAVEVARGCKIVSGSASHDGVVVMAFTDQRHCRTYQAPLRAGGTRRFRWTWTGRANQPGVQLVPGEYVMVITLDGQVASATVTLRE